MVDYWVAGLNMVGSWLCQGLIGRFSTVFGRVGIFADVYLRLVRSLRRRRCGEGEVAQERVDVSPVQIMAQHRSFALLITRVTLLLTPLQTSPHKRCLCWRSLTIQIRSKAHTHQQTLWRKLCTNNAHMNIHQLTHKILHSFSFKHNHCCKHDSLNMWDSLHTKKVYLFNETGMINSTQGFSISLYFDDWCYIELSGFITNLKWAQFRILARK